MPQIRSSQLQANQPIDTLAPDTDLVIAIDANKPLPVGRHTFELEVQDDSGNRSKPMRAQILVMDQTAPTAVIDAPQIVPFGQGFTLSGRRSVDAGGGKVVRYIWTYLPQT